MTERRSRSLPTYAYIKLCRLEAAIHELPAAGETMVELAEPDTAACRGLLQLHRATCQKKLYKLEGKYNLLETRYRKLQTRRQTLELMCACSEPDCIEAQHKWLNHTIFMNNHHLACIKPGQLFIMKHQIDMLLVEIEATERAMAKLPVPTESLEQAMLGPGRPSL